ncbi:C-type lectin mannose-binding isoform-like [Pollicipes pollicipes]|uniref:C-type lectin mannose-binding isoform-like n=1 Tax=Pollicipes pollicipes TaxID=41117 RepID=UPI0018851A5C|nr:C-type lectin mannose-binding isoform-like [Pollicipes pollicipes]
MLLLTVLLALRLWIPHPRGCEPSAAAISTGNGTGNGTGTGTGTDESDRPCPASWWPDAGRCYRVVSSAELPASWHLARVWCARHAPGADLATITTARLNQLVLRHGLMQASGELWVGMTDLFGEGAFRWLDGTPAAFVPWGPNQPDNTASNQHCVALSLANHSWAAPGQWDDDFCHTIKGGFVCQMRP